MNTRKYNNGNRVIFGAYKLFHELSWSPESEWMQPQLGKHVVHIKSIANLSRKLGSSVAHIKKWLDYGVEMGYIEWVKTAPHSREMLVKMVVPPNLRTDTPPNDG